MPFKWSTLNRGEKCTFQQPFWIRCDVEFSAKCMPKCQWQKFNTHFIRISDAYAIVIKWIKLRYLDIIMLIRMNLHRYATIVELLNLWIFQSQSPIPIATIRWRITSVQLVLLPFVWNVLISQMTNGFGVPFLYYFPSRFHHYRNLSECHKCEIRMNERTNQKKKGTSKFHWLLNGLNSQQK